VIIYSADAKECEEEAVENEETEGVCGARFITSSMS
jgi:hypothetical protein